MKNLYYSLCVVAFLTLSSFAPSEACEYAGSNIGFVKSETEKAIETEDHQISRYHTFKALNAIEKSKKQFDYCGCDHAIENMNESLENLKMATRTKTLNANKVLLNKALKNIFKSLEAIEKHNMHDSMHSNDILVMNVTGPLQDKKIIIKPTRKEFYRKTDNSLLNFKESLHVLITTFDCKDAKAYSKKIYEHCEQQLLRPDLSEGIKYYNLKTKEILADAIKLLSKRCDG